MSNPNLPGIPLSARRWTVWIGLCALLGYGIFLARHGGVAAGGADSSGYLNSARLFASGEVRAPLRIPSELGAPTPAAVWHFMPLGFAPSSLPDKIVPTYPTGLPLHYAIAGSLLGWIRGPFVVMLVCALAIPWLCHRAAREMGLAPSLALAGAIVLGVFPALIFTSVQPLSDTPATTWALLSLVAALRVRRDTRWSIAAGVALGVAVLVRPTNLLLAPGLLILVARGWKPFAGFVMGGLPFALWQAGYNHHLYGSALRSGYGDIFSAFSLSYGVPTAWHFAKWLALLLPAPLLFLPLAALFQRQTRTRELLGLVLFGAAPVICYLFYEVSHEAWWDLRFILPAMPALILAALLGAEALIGGPGARLAPILRPSAAVIFSLWAIGLSWHWTPRLGVLAMPHHESAYREASLAARERFPADALVVCMSFSGSLYHYSDLAVLRWDQVEPSAFANYAARARASGRPVRALLFDSEEKDAFARCPGAWTRLAQVRNVGLWQLAP